MDPDSYENDESHWVSSADLPDSGLLGGTTLSGTTLAGGISYSDWSESQSVAKTTELNAAVDRIEAIEKRLAILNDPSPEQLEAFPALREAYEAYKLVEKLVDPDA